MFNVNGNRRPAPSFIVNLSMKNGKYVKPYLQQRILQSGIEQVNRIYGEVTEREIVNSFKSLDMKVSVQIIQSNLEKLDNAYNHILYNIVQDKRTKRKGKDNPSFGSVAYIYVIPKAHLVGNPVQKSDHFIAKMQPDCIVESRDEMKMTNIFKFPRRKRSDIFVKSKAEAEYFSALNDKAHYETVQALRMGKDYFVDDKKVKIVSIKTDLHTIRCVESEAVAKETFKSVYKCQFVGSNYACFANVNVKSLAPGLYRCSFKKEGYLFIELFDSEVTGKVRMVHFLDDKNTKTADILLKYPVLAAWANPEY